MSETVITGYNTLIKSGGNTFAGVTQDDLQLSPETKESITKADAGTKRISITRVPANLTLAGVCSTDNATGVNDREAIIDLVLAKTSLEISYYLDSTTYYEGTGYATGYKETTYADPDNEPSYLLDITCPNGLTKHATSAV